MIGWLLKFLFPKDSTRPQLLTVVLTQGCLCCVFLVSIDDSHCNFAARGGGVLFVCQTASCCVFGFAHRSSRRTLRRTRRIALRNYPRLRPRTGQLPASSAFVGLCAT